MRHPSGRASEGLAGAIEGAGPAAAVVAAAGRDEAGAKAGKDVVLVLEVGALGLVQCDVLVFVSNQ